MFFVWLTVIDFFIGHSLNGLSLSNYELFLIINSNAGIVIRERELYPVLRYGK